MRHRRHPAFCQPGALGAGAARKSWPAGKYVTEVVLPPNWELIRRRNLTSSFRDHYIAPAATQFGGAGLGNIYITPDRPPLMRPILVHQVPTPPLIIQSAVQQPARRRMWSQLLHVYPGHAYGKTRGTAAALRIFRRPERSARGACVVIMRIVRSGLFE